MLGSCFLSPELSSCQHDWLKINSIFKCDSFPQAFHKRKPDRFEEEHELFLPQSGVLPIHCWRGKKKTVENPEECSPVGPPAVSLHPHQTASLRFCQGALRSTLLSSLRGLLCPPPLNASTSNRLSTQALATPGPSRSVKTWAPPPVSRGAGRERWPHSHNF